MKKTKTFDCVEMKRKGSLSIYEDVKDMDFAQKVAYWREQSRKFDEFRNRDGGEPPHKAPKDTQSS